MISTIHASSRMNLLRLRSGAGAGVIMKSRANKLHHVNTNASVVRFFSEELKTEKDGKLVYEGPFASLSLRLKRISISTAAASVMGLPILLTYGSNLPASGQLAVGVRLFDNLIFFLLLNKKTHKTLFSFFKGTAILAATGSTAALSFCFSPYVHKLEWIPVRKCNAEIGDEVVDDDSEGKEAIEKILLKATTRNFFAMPVETVFDPEIDIIHDPKSYRPFCNFLAKGMPFFVHPEVIHDDDLRIKLLGKEKGVLVQEDVKDDGKKKDPDDEFI